MRSSKNSSTSEHDLACSNPNPSLCLSGAFPVLVFGLANLIGDHTDYKDGFVLSMVIEYGAWNALRPLDDNQVRIWHESGLNKIT
jgi:hypothetical protein